MCGHNLGGFSSDLDFLGAELLGADAVTLELLVTDAVVLGLLACLTGTDGHWTSARDANQFSLALWYCSDSEWTHFSFS